MNPQVNGRHGLHLADPEPLAQLPALVEAFAAALQGGGGS
jgi:hypothetical protein